MLWSVGINGDNTLDAIVAPIFLQYLAANVAATTAGQPLPYVTANGFFTTFVNVGGTGATIALALVLWRSKDDGFRKVSRLSLPTQIFQINEPIFFGLPIVLNPVFMVPYVLNAADSHHRQLPAHALEPHSPPGRERALDDASDRRALPGIGRRLEGGGVGRRLDCHRDGGVLSVRQGRRTNARQGGGTVRMRRSLAHHLSVRRGGVPAQDSSSASYRQKVRTFHTAEEFARATSGSVRIDRGIDATVVGGGAEGLYAAARH